MTDFAFDPRLEANHFVADWELSRVMLVRDARFPWLILVPRKPDISEMFDLDVADQVRLTEEIARAGSAFKTITGADKINVAALGNQVAQLHVHIIARFKTDPGWPGSPWISGDALAYAPGAAEAFVKTLQARL